MDLASRHLLAEYDLGNLLYEDKAPIDPKDVNKAFIRSLTLDCTQHFLREFWKAKTNDGILVSVLPDPVSRLPREKRTPKAKELTRWERFAQMKGIKKRKKSRKVWDEASQSWKPRWGKDRVDSVKDKWVLEVPDNADPYEDQFEKLSRARSERRAKNEFARLKNIARTVKKGQAPPLGVLTESEASKNILSRALEITKRSDASMGLFSQEINEQKIANKAEKKHSVKNRGKKGKKGGPSRHARGGKGRGRLSNKK
ncbi:Ribosome biogenesis regulatory protein [Echinococcus granulosus]|uniref:Ribosome biogenesis regulatory protein n=1 Tax=Echinococcus granulosus TaxID=6210 RepID=W6VB26_ECHGR|nr:Ribosome biogenesis regulatory protein [Echinococcus granulosus]EUB63954.1 Ribosome biogenesis regulatory protein [Echinococcus granulosus]